MLAFLLSVVNAYLGKDLNIKHIRVLYHAHVEAKMDTIRHWLSLLKEDHQQVYHA